MGEEAHAGSDGAIGQLAIVLRSFLRPELAIDAVGKMILRFDQRSLGDPRMFRELGMPAPGTSTHHPSPRTQFGQHPKFMGVRHVVQDEPDDHFMLSPEFLCGISRLKEFNLVYDLLIFPKQLPAAIELARRFPEQPFVLDHIAKPPIKDGTLSPWRQQIQESNCDRPLFLDPSFDFGEPLGRNKTLQADFTNPAT